MLFSLIIPVYNRPDEIDDLLQSLCQQSDKGFECVIVEDGSSVTCRDIVARFDGQIPISYYYKENEGRSPARNYGMDRAAGDFFVFVDSDCILPPDYFATLRRHLEAAGATGGIRGGKVQMEKFVPRTFNMGFSQRVYEKVGGFREMFSEDIDMSTRIRQAGYEAQLLRDVFVYHKRRGDLRKFWRQVHVFGMSRITLQLLYPGSMEAVHWMPACFTLGSAALLAAAPFQPWTLAPLGLYATALFGSAAASTKNLATAFRAVGASFVQLLGYGTGFLRAYIWKILLRHGRDEAQEIALRKGK